MAQAGRTRHWWRDHGLLIVNVALFVLFLGGMALTGWQVSSDDSVQHGGEAVGFGSYLASGDFVEATFENWESEFLQMGSYVVLTVFLFQKGSAESKVPGERAAVDADPRRKKNDPKAPWPVRRGGVWLALYENSLVLLFVLLFLGAFVGHLLGGAAAYSAEQLEHGAPAVGAWEFLGSSEFWFQSMQNWQSEFLAVAVLVGASVVLRQRGSPESKPVAAPNSETG